MSWLLKLLVPVVLSGSTAVASAMEVRFARDSYEVVAGGEATVEVVMEFGPGEMPDDIFSYGVRLVTAGDGGVLARSVAVPAELNFSGFLVGAMVDLSPGVMGVKGNTQFVDGGFQAYTGPLLATFTLVGLEPGVVDLGLEIYRTLGASEDVFVAADGTKLDETITFGSATLTVGGAPELVITRGDPGRVRVSYAMDAGLRYILRRSEDLEAWEVVAETVGGPASEASFEFSTSPADRAFFQLEAVPVAP